MVGKVKFTKSRLPVSLIFLKKFESYQEAFVFEKKMIILPSLAGSSNGRTQLSESCYLGSNPSPAALESVFEE